MKAFFGYWLDMKTNQIWNSPEIGALEYYYILFILFFFFVEEYAFYCDIWEYRCNIFYKQKKWGESNLSWSQFISASQFLIKTIVYFHLFASNIFIWITIVRQQYMNYDLIFFFWIYSGTWSFLVSSNFHFK